MKPTDDTFATVLFHVIGRVFTKLFLTIFMIIIGYVFVVLPLMETADSISSGSYYWHFRGSHGYANIQDGRFRFWFVMAKRSIFPLLWGILGSWGLICLWFTEWLPNKPSKLNPATAPKTPPAKQNIFPPKPADSSRGQYWTSDEESELIREFGQMMKIENIARAHRRTPRAIRMRLEKIGLLAPNDKMAE